MPHFVCWEHYCVSFHSSICFKEAGQHMIVRASRIAYMEDQAGLNAFLRTDYRQVTAYPNRWILNISIWRLLNSWKSKIFFVTFLSVCQTCVLAFMLVQSFSYFELIIRPDFGKLLNMHWNIIISEVLIVILLSLYSLHVKPYGYILKD